MRSMQSLNKTGSVITLLCDDGERYRETYFSDPWLQAQGLGCGPERDAVDALIDRGVWPAPLLHAWRLAGDLQP
jgi:cysteine synthase